MFLKWSFEAIYGERVGNQLKSVAHKLLYPAKMVRKRHRAIRVWLMSSDLGIAVL